MARTKSDAAWFAVKDRRLLSDVERPRRAHGASLRAALSSRRIGAVTLQSFSSGLPLGLVWIALPAFLTYRGVDIKTVGLFSLAQAPWTFKFLWSPLMDRFGPRLRLGSAGADRGSSSASSCSRCSVLALWRAFGTTADVTVIALLALLIAFGSASQDIVIDAYAVEVLERSRAGARRRRAHGARRGRPSSSRAPSRSRSASASAGRRCSPVSRSSSCRSRPWCSGRRSRRSPPPPPRTLREAVFGPLLDLFRRQGILPILGFLFFYKFGENLATALDPAVPDPEVLRARGRRARHGDDRTDLPDHRDPRRRRLDRAHRTDALPVDLRLPPGRRVPRPGPRRSPHARLAVRGRRSSARSSSRCRTASRCTARSPSRISARASRREPSASSCSA